ncbi:hypothetical protein QQF64_032844 [Cirrhinus molitorella]|uniref:Uncharacterized protein n=1 Tax=Cirrhinus molitorella TaxID=172907 RepID=A0ABR3MS75_9TELE
MHAAKQAHKRSIICRQRCERMLHPVIETSNSSIEVPPSLTLSNTHTPSGWPVPFSQSDKQTLCKICFSLACSHTQILLLLYVSSRVSHSGARGRRRAKQPSVWWLLPQIVTTKHPEYWAATLLIWRQAINSVPAQRGKRSPQRPQFVSSASVRTHIIFIWQWLY